MRDWVYTEHEAFWLPDRELFLPELRTDMQIEPLRGYAYTLAVRDGNVPLGWVRCETLGYLTARRDRRVPT